MAQAPCYSSESFLPVTNEHDRVSSQNFSSIQRKSRNFQNILQSPYHDAFNRPPWKKRTEPYSCGVVGLHEEINDFYETMHPTERETDLRLKVIEHITQNVHFLWPQAQVEVFGSFRTGLYLPSSDIDMVIIGEWRSLPLSTLSKALENSGLLPSDITIIANASVPIIKLIHSPSKIRVDISFNLRNGLHSAKFIKKLMKQYPVLPKLVLVLKQFLLHRGLNEVYSGGMSSYCLTLMIVSFLQGFHKPKIVSSNLGTLLIEFFEHYGINFNYEKVAIHFEGGGSYRPKERMECYMSIKDPLDPDNDVAKGTYRMHCLKLAFQNAYHLLSKAVIESGETQLPVESFLHLIFKVEEEVFSLREITLNNCPRIIRKIDNLIEELNSNHTPVDQSKNIAGPSSKNFKKRKSK